jgi:hypothetical protein
MGNTHDESPDDQHGIYIHRPYSISVRGQGLAKRANNDNNELDTI